MDKMDLNDLRLLLRVIEHGSFTAAAAATGIPVSTISQRIAAFETAVGTGLLRRSTRSLSPTEAAGALLPYARAVDAAAKQAEQALLDQGNEPRGTLRVTTSFALAQFALAPILPEFLADNPHVTVSVDVTNRFVDLIGEGYDLAVRAYSGSLKDSSLRQKVLTRTPWSLAAAPGWIAANRPLSEPQDLASCDTLYFAASPEAARWVLTRGVRSVEVPLSPRLWSHDMATLRRAAIGGAGVVSLPTYILKSALQDGRLKPTLAGWSHFTSTIYLLSPPKQQTSKLAAMFSDYLSRKLNDRLLERDAEGGSIRR